MFAENKAAEGTESKTGAADGEKKADEAGAGGSEGVAEGMVKVVGNASDGTGTSLSGQVQVQIARVLMTCNSILYNEFVLNIFKIMNRKSLQKNWMSLAKSRVSIFKAFQPDNIWIKPLCQFCSKLSPHWARNVHQNQLII